MKLSTIIHKFIMKIKRGRVLKLTFCIKAYNKVFSVGLLCSGAEGLRGAPNSGNTLQLRAFESVSDSVPSSP